MGKQENAPNDSSFDSAEAILQDGKCTQKNGFIALLFAPPRSRLSVSQVTEIKCPKVSWARQGHPPVTDSKGEVSSLQPEACCSSKKILMKFGRLLPWHPPIIKCSTKPSSRSRRERTTPGFITTAAFSNHKMFGITWDAVFPATGAFAPFEYSQQCHLSPSSGASSGED